MSTNGLQVPYSNGRNFPKLQVPKGACDAHHHIFDPVKFSYSETDTRNQPPATVDAYKLLQKKLGLTRNVIVTPSAYGTDNSCTLDALKQFGDNARAIITVSPDIEDEEIARLNKLGVRGVRYNITRGASGSLDDIKKVADKISKYNWHICFWMPADTLVSMKDFLTHLPCKICFDHRGHLPADQGVNHPAFGIIAEMMKSKQTWVKLSALYHDSNAPYYSDTVAIGKAFVSVAPDQILWGTDWPHPSEFSAKKDFPNDADLLDLLMEQAQTEENIYKILVENPQKLFGFKS